MSKIGGNKNAAAGCRITQIAAVNRTAVFSDIDRHALCDKPNLLHSAFCLHCSAVEIKSAQSTVICHNPSRKKRSAIKVYRADGTCVICNIYVFIDHRHGAAIDSECSRTRIADNKRAAGGTIIIERKRSPVNVHGCDLSECISDAHNSANRNSPALYDECTFVYVKITRSRKSTLSLLYDLDIADELDR